MYLFAEQPFFHLILITTRGAGDGCLLHLMDKKTEAWKGDSGLQAGADTALCLWGIWGLFYGYPLPWVPLVLCCPFALCPAFPPSAECWSCFLCNSIYCDLLHLPEEGDGQGMVGALSSG